MLEHQITNLKREKSPIERQIKNFESLHNDFYKRFNLLYAEQLNIDDCIANNEELVKKFKNTLKDKKKVLYRLKNIYRNIDTVSG